MSVESSGGDRYSLVDQDDVMDILDRQLPGEPRTDVDYPLEDSDSFETGNSFGQFDIIVLEDGEALGFSVADSTEELDRVISDVSSARSYLEAEGYDTRYAGLVFDDSLASFKEALGEMPPVFTLDRLREEWGDSGSWQDFHDAWVLSDLRTVARKGYIEDDRTLPRFQYETLEEQGLLREEDGQYVSTEALDSVLSEDDYVLHASPRAGVLYHPSEFG